MSDLTNPSTTSLTELRRHTPARIGLHRTGNSISTKDALAFTLAHAQARDAVHARLDTASIITELTARSLHAISVHSAAPDRATYLRRPDLGRTLSVESQAALSNSAPPPADQDDRLCIVLADGLSALATQRHAIPVLDALLPLLAGIRQQPAIVIATQARVALGDEIAEALGAKALLVLIGERPGLSASDSLGAYLTWEPRPGRSNAERNCISNIRAEGLSPAAAAARIAYYLEAARQLGETGITLKDPEEEPHLERSIPTARLAE